MDSSDSSSANPTTPSPYATTCTSIFKDLEKSLMALIIGHPCTSTTCNTCTQSPIETTFTELIKLDYGTSISLQRIKYYEAEIPQYKKSIEYAEAEILRHNKLIEQDKINRSMSIQMNN